MTTVCQAEPAGELRGGAELDLPGGRVLRFLVPARVQAHWLVQPAAWRLPGAPPELRGVTYWRGRLAPVFDVARWLDPAEPARELAHVLLLSLGSGLAGLRVRGEPQLIEVSPGAPAAIPAAAPPALQAFLSPRLIADGRVFHEFDVEPWLVRVRASPVPATARSAEEPA